VIDDRLRAAKDRLVEPAAARLPAAVSPGLLTALSFTCCVGAGALASAELTWWSLAAWLLGRLLDGLDGAVARRRGRSSDLGGYLDLMADTVGYAAVPIGIAAGRGDTVVWVACAVLLATFYVNTMSWTLLSALAEKRAAGAAARGERTSVHMPTGLVEGAETIVLFSLMLALPDQAQVLFWLMAALVAITIVQRLVWARASLA
jgi:phosphatidylglycerophosphate synthase